MFDDNNEDGDMTEKKDEWKGLSEEDRQFKDGLEREIKKANKPLRVEEVDALRRRSQGIASAVNARNRFNHKR